MASFKWIIGRLILDISQAVQSFQTFVISCFGTDLADSHKLVTGNTYWVFEPVTVPKLEQRDVQTNVGGIKRFVFSHFIEKACEVFNIIHGAELLHIE